MEERTKKYMQELRQQIGDIFDLAAKNRAKGLDPHVEVEALPAGDLADRVEGLVGPKGIAKVIREKGRDNISQIIDSMLTTKPNTNRGEKEAEIEQALRSTLAILTEGVVAAPIEGISGVKICENPDSSQYLSIYFAGPIRSAGGTAQGLAVLVGEYIANKVGLMQYRPTGDEIERYVEEIKLYDERVSRLQYKATEDEIREIVTNVAVCIDGDSTEKIEVAIHRDLKRVASNRIRGGMCLVIAEGMAQKRKKIMKHAEKIGIDWSFLADLKKTEDNGENQEKPKAKFMDEVVGGRPIFSAPSAKGGFRLRYGHSRDNGLAAKSMHPATLILVDDFIATGTQVKVEKPGKGCIITECDTVDGPIVKLKDGSVVKVETRNMAYELKDQVQEILFLGDILVSYGDFLQTNTKLAPSAYVSEWWRKQTGYDGPPLKSGEALEYAKKTHTPLHPNYTYRFSDITCEQAMKLAKWLGEGEVGQVLAVKTNAEAKRILELIGCCHEVQGEHTLIKDYKPLLAQLGMQDGESKKLNEKIEGFQAGESALKLIEKVSTVKVRDVSGSYIGARMGRPEKARERKMQPAVHSLFPIGSAGGRERSINHAVEQGKVEVEVSQYLCPTCRKKHVEPVCPDCKRRGIPVKYCGKCGYTGDKSMCPRCEIETRGYSRQDLDIKEHWERAIAKIGKSTKVKGVMGMISESKNPEPIEKGLLRALNEVYVFKDGTIRFDATDAPLTHFRPREIGVAVDRLVELGYDLDIYGKRLESEDQILEIRTQDIVISEYCGTYFVKVCRFVDELLKKFYQTEPFYNVQARDGLIGHLVAGLAPHTSAAVTGRIIGFTKANVVYAHPFWHAAKRRNCDGDEDAVMMLMDVLLNFSKSYLPQKRGGKMDAPLVITTVMDAKEIDDEAHKMETVFEYSLEFYEKTLEGVNPSDVDVETISDILDTHPNHSLGFTHDTSDITGPVTKSRYVTLKTMREKIDAQLGVAEKIRAIDEKDVANIIINSHFLRDTYGNLRAFSRQRFRCVKCNENYRRVPLVGKCTKCGGKLLLTVSQGNIRKYLDMSQELAQKYSLSDYLKSRLKILEADVDSLTTNDLDKQVSLSDFM